MSLSLMCIGLKLQNIYLMQYLVHYEYVVYYAYNWTLKGLSPGTDALWISIDSTPNIFSFSQSRCDFLSFSVLTEHGQPLRPSMLSCTLIVSLNLSRETLFLVWLERYSLECPSEIAVEFGQLISWRNKLLQHWSSPARNIFLLLDPLKMGNQT